MSFCDSLFWRSLISLSFFVLKLISISPNLQFHISQVIIFHTTSTFHNIVRQYRIGLFAQKWLWIIIQVNVLLLLAFFTWLCQNLSRFTVFRAPKNSKSAHNLAHPSGKGLQTADNWLELELNSIFVQKTSFYCLIMLCNVGVVVERWGKWWPGKCGNVDWEKYLSNLVQKPGNWSMTFRKVTATAWMVNEKNSDKFPATLGMCRPTFARF